MIRSSLTTFAFATLVLLAVAVPAHAQDLGTELARRAGSNVDLRTEHALRAKLLERGLIKATDAHLHVSAEVLETVFGQERLRNHLFETRYHVGDRVLVEDKGSAGSYNPRAVITEVTADGKYKVKIWDKVESITQPNIRSLPNEFTGETPGTPETRYKVRHPDGSVTEASSVTPWLVHQNEREITLTHEQLEKLNGRVNPAGAYSINGWAVDPATDPVLADRIAKAKALAEKLMPPSVMTLPEDPTARKAKLEEIARLQVKLVDQLFTDNLIDHPINPGVSDRMTALMRARPELKGKVGAVLESRCGVCFDQAAAMTAILRSVSQLSGLEAKAISGSTLGEGIPHGFIELRFANGKLGMFDPSWHHRPGSHVVENMDFALFDARRYSNRRIDRVHEGTTDKVPFVDRRSEKGRELFRGYDKVSGEALLALRVRERAALHGESLEVAATKVLAENTGPEKIAGDFTAKTLATRAEAVRAPTPGMIDALRDRVRDRTTDRAHIR